MDDLIVAFCAHSIFRKSQKTASWSNSWPKCIKCCKNWADGFLPPCAT